MAAIDDAVGTLESLGVTRTEARLYLELLRRGPGTGYDVARRSGVARANTYAALEALTARGLAERSGAAPVTFSAVAAPAVTARLAAGYAESLDRFEEALRILSEDLPDGPPLLERFDGNAAARAAIERIAARADATVAARLPHETLRTYDPMVRGLQRRGIAPDVGPSPEPSMGYVLVDQRWAAVWRLGGLGLWGDEPLLRSIVARLLEPEAGSDR